MMRQNDFDDMKGRLEPELGDLNTDQLREVFEMVREAWHIQIAKKAQSVMESFREGETVKITDARNGQVFTAEILSLNTKSVSVMVNAHGGKLKWRVPPTWLSKIEPVRKVA